jgi:hypothetical protein
MPEPDEIATTAIKVIPGILNILEKAARSIAESVIELT